MLMNRSKLSSGRVVKLSKFVKIRAPKKARDTFALTSEVIPLASDAGTAKRSYMDLGGRVRVGGGGQIPPKILGKTPCPNSQKPPL
jgi:hypothetical protein